jgi:hypothetical protein
MSPDRRCSRTLFKFIASGDKKEVALYNSLLIVACLPARYSCLVASSHTAVETILAVLSVSRANVPPALGAICLMDV